MAAVTARTRIQPENKHRFVWLKVTDSPLDYSKLQVITASSTEITDTENEPAPRDAFTFTEYVTEP